MQSTESSANVRSTSRASPSKSPHSRLAKKEDTTSGVITVRRIPFLQRARGAFCHARTNGMIEQEFCRAGTASRAWQEVAKCQRSDLNDREKENLSETTDCLAMGSECRGSFRGRRRASRRKMQPLGASNGRGMLPAGSRPVGKQTRQAHQEICQWKVSTVGFPKP